VTKTAYILSNIGTPESPEAVAPYLTEFLTDPDVIPLPYLLRHLLVRGWIVPRRAPASAKKYALIWTSEGSPLMVNSKLLQKRLQHHLPGPVLLGMQFGNPSMESAYAEARKQGCDRVMLVPLYPQYAEATTGSAMRKAAELGKNFGFQKLAVFPPFPTADFFIKPLAGLVRQNLQGDEHVLFSFHGLPESQVKKGTKGCLVEPGCCDRPIETLSKCYRAQSIATAKALAATLDLKANQWSVSFQSRLGRSKWISPYTEDVLRSLPGKDVKKVLVVSPSFVSDCLETLEELGHEGREVFAKAGGEEFRLVPCLNGDENFARGLAEKLYEL
jgi:ferrochelatase